MQTTLKRLIKLTAGYSLVTLIGPLFTILLFPLYTRVLEPADYGIVEKALTFHSLLSIFVTMGMDQALSAYFFTGDQAFRRNLVTTAVISVSVVSIVIAVLVALFANKIAQILFQSVEYSTLVYLIALLLISAPLYGLTASALRLNMGIKLVNTLGFSYLLSFVTCNIIFVLILRWNATGIVAANAIANLLSASVGLYLIYKPLLGRFSLSIARSLAISGFGLIPGVLGSVMLANIDRLLLVPYVSNSEIGLYGIANKLASMLYVLLNAGLNAWWPIALEMFDKPDAARQFARIFEYFIACSMLVALAIGLFASEIIDFFARPQYAPAAPYTLALLVYNGPLAFSASLFSISLFARKRTYLISVAFLFAASLNIVLNLILNPRFGVWGAVWATVAAGLVVLVINYVYGQKILFVNYRWPQILLLSALYLTIVIMFLTFPILNVFAYKTIAITIFGGAIIVTGVISYTQIKLGFGFLMNRIGNLKVVSFGK